MYALFLLMKSQSPDKPAWYTEGPKNIDDQMDFDDMKMPQFHDQAICKIECINSFKKSKIMLILC